jgi:hypothetical protein
MEAEVENLNKPKEWQVEKVSDSVAEVKQTKPSRKWPLSAGCLGLLALGLCVGFAFLFISAGAYTTANDNMDEWLDLSDAYMEALSNRDIDTAYKLFSSEARQEFSRRDMELMVEGPLFAAFVNYEKLEIDSWEVNYELSTGKNVVLAGPVSYQGSYEGYFEAVLKEEEGGWKIFWFNVNAPTEKYNEFSNS